MLTTACRSKFLFKQPNDFLWVTPTNWHSIWHIFWHSIWHCVWPIFWHSIWHFIWNTLKYSLALFRAYYLTFVLTFYLAFFLSFYWTSILAFFLDLSGIYSDILSGMCSGPGAAHCIQHLRYRVRVQAWPTASRARDMARIRWCPQSRQGVDEERRKEGGKEWVGVSRSEWVRPGPYLAGGNNVRANWLEPKWQSFVGRRVSNLWPMPIFDDKHPHCVVCYMKTSFFIPFMPNLGLLCIVRIIYQNPHMLN